MARVQISKEKMFPEVTSAYVSHEPSELVCLDESRTRQEFADDCDINVIVKRFEAQGVLTHLRPDYQEAWYGDLTGLPSDLHSAMGHVAEAGKAFMALPAQIRETFQNDPVSFVEFAQNPGNLGKLREWGLAAPAAASGAPEAPPAPQPAPAAQASPEAPKAV